MSENRVCHDCSTIMEKNSKRNRKNIEKCMCKTKSELTQ